MIDIVEVLRQASLSHSDYRWEAADEIERLGAEVARLRAALHPFAEAAGKFDPDEGDGSQHVWGWSPTIGMLRKARAALEENRE